MRRNIFETTIEKLEKENQDLRQLLRITIKLMLDGEPSDYIIKTARARLVQLEEIRANW